MAKGTTLSESTIQSAVWQIELGRGRLVVYWVLLVLLALALGLVYTASEFRGLEKREAMDLAQVARNAARGEGFTTKVIRPLSLWQLEQAHPGGKLSIERHPDLLNPPLYAWTLSRLFRLLPAEAFEPDPEQRFYAPERWVILPFNQVCLLLSLLVIFLWASQLFDQRVAVTAALLLLFSDTLWQHGISGLPTPFLMLLLLLAMYGLFLLDRRETAAAAAGPAAARLWPADPATWALLVGSAGLFGLCFLTRYSMAWLLAPVLVYVAVIGRGWRGRLWALVYLVVFAAVILPWLWRNQAVAGNPLGIARFGPLEFGTETLMRSLDPATDGRLANVLAVGPLGANILLRLRQGLFEWLPRLGDGFLMPLFLVGLLYGFRRPEAQRLRGVLIAVLVTGVVGMAVSGIRPEPSGPLVHGSDLLVLWYPLAGMFGVAFFYLLLDRIAFRIRLTRALVVAGFAGLQLLPLVLTLLPPRRGYMPYPPYAAPVTRAVAALFEKTEIGCSDLPWIMAWAGDRSTVQLPMTIDEFTKIHDWVLPNPGMSFLMLTPYMLDRPLQSGLFRGEYEGWAPLIRGRMPRNFPLKAMTALPPNRQQYLFADRNRWEETVIEEPDPEERKKQAAAAAAGTPAPAAADDEPAPAAAAP